MTLLIIILIGIYLIMGNRANFKERNEKRTTTATTTTTVKQENKKTANITLVGDFLFESPLIKDIENGNNTYFELVKEIFANDDLSIGNMEVVIGNDNLKISGDGYNFCAPRSIGELVASLDIEVLSTTNNHSYDRGFEGIKSTLDFFKNNSDILTVGTKEKNEQEDKIIEINDIKFGFLAYTLGTNIKVDDEYKYAVSRYRDPVTKSTEKYKEEIKKSVEDLKTKTDVIIVMMHWGNEFTYEPNEEQKDMANFLNSIGVDIIYGSHSHSIQPIQELDNNYKTLVYYSLGNFVSADEDISRTGEEFDNAYNVGLISTLKVVKENDIITIEDVKASPVINYYDKDLKNFKLIPFNKYAEEFEKKHFRYNQNFNKNFIEKIYNNIIDSKYHTKK